jgi:nucleoside-diphosphate-sugar epimerase
MHASLTGGAGFVGSHLSDALLAAGHHDQVLDDLSPGSMTNIAHLKGHARCRYAIDTVSNEGLLAELVGTADVVFHLLRRSASRRSSRNRLPPSKRMHSHLPLAPLQECRECRRGSESSS